MENRACLSPSRFRTVLIGLVFSALSTWVAAGTVYSIQIGAFPTQEEADAVRSRVSAFCSPVFVVNTQDSSSFPYKVRVGCFPYYAEAWVARKSMDDALLPDRFIVKWEMEGPLVTEQSLPLVQPFSTQGIDASVKVDPNAHYTAAGLIGDPTAKTSTVLLSTLSATTRDQLIKDAIAGPTNEVALVAADKFLKEFPADSAVNRVRLQKARLMGGKDPVTARGLLDKVQSNGSAAERQVAKLVDAYIAGKEDRAKGIEKFRSLANDATQPVSLRREAMRRFAGHSHAVRNYPDAWLAFDRIQKTSDDPDVVADARVNLAGLAFEMCDSGKGTWDEVRALCESVHALPNVPHRREATADLMHLETWFKQENFAKALEEAEAFVKTYPDVPREYYVGRTWQGVILYKLNRIDESAAVLQSVLNASIPDGEKFGKVEPRAWSALWLSFIAAGQGDLAARDAYINVLVEEFPTSKEMTKAVEYFGSQILTTR